MNCLKDPQERSPITLRDMFYVYTVMVALKVDDVLPYSWKLVFALPWMYFATAFLLGAIVSHQHMSLNGHSVLCVPSVDVYKLISVDIVRDVLRNRIASGGKLWVQCCENVLNNFNVLVLPVLMCSL